MTLLGVFGNPIEHSRSLEIHAAFAAQCGLDIEYRKILVPEGGFVQAAVEFIEAGAAGFNITVPNKFDAYRFATHTSDAARVAEAVNTIRVGQDGRLDGYNTDGEGLVADLTLNLRWPIAGQRLLFIGAGGAARGVLGSLLAQNPAQITLVNRTFERANELVTRLAHPNLVAKQFEELDDVFDLVISASSAGLFGQAQVSLPEGVVVPATRCYDMIYGASTPFLEHCRHQGVVDSSDGIGMLVEQAALAFEVWFNQQVDTGPVIQMLRSTT